MLLFDDGMTTKPHDALFKATFETPEHATGIFRALLPAAVCDAVVWETMMRESGSFIDPELADSHSDLLFSVRLYGDDDRAPVYLLLEHQSSNDEDMPLRLLAYLVRIWERARKAQPGTPLPLIIPAVISHVPGGWMAPRRFDELFDLQRSTIVGLDVLVPRFSMLVDDLAQLSNADIKARSLAAFPKLVLWALRDTRDAARFIDNIGQWDAEFDEAARAEQGLTAFVQLLRYVSLVGNDQQLKKFRAKLQEHSPETERVAMTSIIEQAREQARAEVLRQLLTLKFGVIEAKLDSRIEAAMPNQLDRYLARILTATTVAAVFED